MIASLFGHRREILAVCFGLSVIPILFCDLNRNVLGKIVSITFLHKLLNSDSLSKQVVYLSHE